MPSRQAELFAENEEAAEAVLGDDRDVLASEDQFAVSPALFDITQLFAEIGESPHDTQGVVPVGPYLRVRRDKRVEFAFGKVPAHYERKGVRIIRHMIPWWEAAWFEED